MIPQIATNGVERLAKICAALAGGTILALAALLFADVVCRGLGRPLFGAQDIAEMAMIMVTFGAVALLDQQYGQIRVDLLSNHLPPILRRLTNRLSFLLAAVVYSVLAWTLWDAAALSAMLSLSTNILSLPKAPFQYLMAVLAFFAALNAFLRCIVPDIRKYPND